MRPSCSATTRKRFSSNSTNAWRGTRPASSRSYAARWWSSAPRRSTWRCWARRPREARGSTIRTRAPITPWGSGDEADQALETLRHKGTHQFVRQFIGSKCPLWLDEGLAEFFEQAQFVGGQLQVGQTPPYHLRELKLALEEKRLFSSIPDMLVRTHEAWLEAVKSGSKEAPLQYAEAWAMVHFLQGADDATYPGPFIQYIWHLGRGRSSKEAWDAAFGDSVAAFEKRFRDYIKELQPSVSRTCRRTNMQLLGFMLIDLGARGACRYGGLPPVAPRRKTGPLDLQGRHGRHDFNRGPRTREVPLSLPRRYDPQARRAQLRTPPRQARRAARRPMPLPRRPFPGTHVREGQSGKLKSKIVSKPATSPAGQDGPGRKSPASTGAKKP